MAEELFYFVVHPNDVIVRRETGASFESSAPVMFRHNDVRTLVELKQLILSHLGPAGGIEIANLVYRFQAITADNRLEYRPSWISEDSHVWMTFEVHKRVMDDKFMEFYAEVRHVGSSSGFRPPGPSAYCRSTSGGPSAGVCRTRSLSHVVFMAAYWFFPPPLSGGLAPNKSSTIPHVGRPYRCWKSLTQPPTGSPWCRDQGCTLHPVM
ncbi:hypothetical protein PIB30_076432 [Stylosanthes scabra]|uniref:Uncharacterized protein n=1 Tax=Stylosanthes scabra TaxID=79078 RepID=A0ABU6QQD5_9FABA|nr:hypothetical protein [Stylosanthes scabra]